MKKWLDAPLVFAAIVVALIFFVQITQIAVCGEAYDKHDGNQQDYETWAHFLFGDSLKISTWVIAIFTAVLGGVTIWQSGHLKREFIAVHRPKIITRAFETAHDVDAPHFLSIRFHYVNTGGSRARIIEIRRHVTVTDNLPARIDYADNEHEKMNIVLEPGENRLCWFTSRYVHANATQSHTQGLYIVGDIAYVDGLGIKRKTGFCRSHHALTQQWQRLKDSEHEYED